MCVFGQPLPALTALSAFLTQAIDIQRNYLDVLNQYNQSAIGLAYYLNQ